MGDGSERVDEQEARNAREARLVSNRISELYENPIQGNFDLAHLQAVHAYIFQDLPEHQPGVVRADSDGWNKVRELEGQGPSHVVRYAHEDIAGRIETALEQFGGPDTIKGIAPPEAAARLAQLYGDLDYAHGFYEGNSRTLREFTRELAADAGFTLDWVKTGVDTEQRNALYVARDVAVLERAFPELTEQRAMATEDRAEYESWWHIEKLRDLQGTKSLETIIGDGLTPDRGVEIERDALGHEDYSPVRDDTKSVERGPIMVFDAVTDALCSLVEFVAELFVGGGERTAPKVSSPLAEMEARERAVEALDNVRGSMERGESLRAEDVRNLTPEHLASLSAHGDDAMRALVQRESDERGHDWGYDRER